VIRGRERRLALALAISAVAIVGCRPPRPRPALPAVLPTAEQLLGGIADRRRALTSLRAVARIAYESGAERAGARHAVVVRPPDHFHLEVLSPLGAVAVVVCDGTELAVWIRRDRRTYRGPATAASVAAYTGVPVSVPDVVSVLLGLPPERHAVPPERRPAPPPTVVRDVAAGLVRVHTALDDGTEDIWFAPDSLLPVASETSVAGGGQTLRVEFADYRSVDGIEVPLTIDMRLDGAGGRVRIRYEPPALGAAVADELFTFPPRPDVEELRLDAYQGGPS